MKREDKNRIIENLTDKIKGASHFYLADISTLNAEDTSQLRRKCFEKDIELVVVKNTLLKKALENVDGNFEEMYNILEQPTSVMFCETGNVPAKLIKEFRKEHDRPVLKAAFVEESVYVGDENLDSLATLKSKEELIGDVMLALQSPANNLVSALNGAAANIAGVLKTLSEKENN
ncbi:MAG: 50S ribosomal protein L10 [Bacteroidota bacterium]